MAYRAIGAFILQLYLTEFGWFQKRLPMELTLGNRLRKSQGCLDFCEGIAVMRRRDFIRGMGLGSVGFVLGGCNLRLSYIAETE